jgi:hypothetical protein
MNLIINTMKQITCTLIAAFLLSCQAKDGKVSGTFYGSVGAYQYGGMKYLIFQPSTTSGAVAVVNYTLDSIQLKNSTNEHIH